MDAARYFEMMHRAMSARKRDTTLLLRVKVQDLGGADAYLELRQEPCGGATSTSSCSARAGSSATTLPAR